jgi:hypothetical protein
MRNDTASVQKVRETKHAAKGKTLLPMYSVPVGRIARKDSKFKLEPGATDLTPSVVSCLAQLTMMHASMHMT